MTEDQHIRRITLPTGNVVEVVYEHGCAQTVEEEIVVVDVGRELHCCSRCCSPLLQPVDWAPAGDEHWAIIVRCPECELVEELLAGQQQCEAYDEVLQESERILVEGLSELRMEIAEDEVEAFVSALRCDLIVPEDFMQV